MSRAKPKPVLKWAKCPKCAEEMYRVEGLTSDSDGLRSNYWCEDCKIMYASYAEGYYARLVLKDKYESPAKERILGLLAAAMREVRGHAALEEK